MRVDQRLERAEISERMVACALGGPSRDFHPGGIKRKITGDDHRIFRSRRFVVLIQFNSILI